MEVHQAECQLDHELVEQSRGDMAPLHAVGNQCDESYCQEVLGWRPPLQVLTGRTVDISILLVFMFWDVVKCSRYEDHEYKGQVSSMKQSEIIGHFVGFSHNIGHKLTFLVLTDDTRSVISRSRVTLVKTEENNLKLDDDFGKLQNQVHVQSKHDGKEDSIKLPKIAMPSWILPKQVPASLSYLFNYHLSLIINHKNTECLFSIVI
jgi:hypothetical protein